MEILKVDSIDYAMIDGEYKTEYVGKIIYDENADIYTFFDEICIWPLPPAIVGLMEIIENQESKIEHLKKDMHGYSAIKEENDYLKKELQDQMDLNMELKAKKSEPLHINLLAELKKSYTAEEIIKLREAGLI